MLQLGSVVALMLMRIRVIARTVTPYLAVPGGAPVWGQQQGREAGGLGRGSPPARLGPRPRGGGPTGGLLDFQRVLSTALRTFMLIKYFF